MNALELSNRYFVEASRFLCERLPAGTCEQMPGLFAALGNVPFPFFNTMILDSPVSDEADLRKRIQLACECGSKCGLPWILVMCSEWAPENMAEICRGFGLVQTMTVTAMVAELLRPPRRPLPELKYEHSRGQKTFDLLARINCAAYGLPAELASSIAYPELWDDPTYPVVAFAGDEPVSCSATLVLDGILYVSWVATLPGHRRKGYAEAAMRKSLEVASRATGLTSTWLHASEAGCGLYLAMGYETAARFLLYSIGPPERP